MTTLARVDRMDDEAIREAFPREQPRKSVGTGTKQKVLPVLVVNGPGRRLIG